MSLDLEAKLVNNYDVKAFVELLQIGDHYVAADDADRMNQSRHLTGACLRATSNVMDDVKGMVWTSFN